MALSVAQFRIDFPEFADTTTYLDSGISFWIKAAGLLLNQRRFGTIYDLATELFVAHNVALGQYNLLGGQGGVPGLSRGVISSESGGSVSASYDTGSATVVDAGHWNLTDYGTRFIWLVRMFGAGPIQVGPGCGGLDGFFLPVPLGFSFGPGWYAPGNTYDFQANL